MAADYKSVISGKKQEAESLMTDKQFSACNVAIHTASVAAGAEGVIPIPGADAIPISLTQMSMVLALGKIFDRKISDSAAKALIGAAASTFVGRNLVKLIPIAGWVASAVVAAGVTEAIGWTIAVDFARSSSNVSSVDSSVEEVSADDGTTMEPDTYYDTSSDQHESEQESQYETGMDEEKDDDSITNDFSEIFGDEDF